jgi:hypothetical protein
LVYANEYALSRGELQHKNETIFTARSAAKRTRQYTRKDNIKTRLTRPKPFLFSFFFPLLLLVITGRYDSGLPFFFFRQWFEHGKD